MSGIENIICSKILQLVFYAIMTDPLTQTNRLHSNKLTDDTLDRVNKALLSYSDKDWNYSRIALIIKPLTAIDGPYVLNFEILDLTKKEGRSLLKTLTDEVRWGERHSSELGLLEVVSLRINNALLEVTSDEFWGHARPVVRITKKDAVSGETLTSAFWYQITEVAGEEFDNR